MAFGPALKTATNPHFRSKYADLSACVEAVIEALNANGIALIQRTLDCADGVVVTTVFLHESGELIDSGKLHVPAAKNDPQGYGSALTYARRYSLMAACGIAPEDDDGNAASRKPEQTSGSAQSGTEAMRAAWRELQPETQDHLRQRAITIDAAATTNAAAAKEMVEQAVAEWPEEDPNTVKMGLWSILDSKTKTAIRKVA
jgi:hypothetical protein